MPGAPPACRALWHQEIPLCLPEGPPEELCRISACSQQHRPFICGISVLFLTCVLWGWKRKASKNIVSIRPGKKLGKDAKTEIPSCFLERETMPLADKDLILFLFSLSCNEVWESNSAWFFFLFVCFWMFIIFLHNCTVADLYFNWEVSKRTTPWLTMHWHRAAVFQGDRESGTVM